MALKIFTGARPSLKTDMELLNIAEVEMLSLMVDMPSLIPSCIEISRGTCMFDPTDSKNNPD